MSENALVAKIKHDTKEVVADIVAAGEAEVAVIKRETEEKRAALRAAHQTSLQKQHAQLELVTVSRAKQAAKIAVQEAKRTEIDALFAAVEAKLIAQPADTYVAYFTKLVADAVPADASISAVHAPAAREAETKQILGDNSLAGEIVADNTITAGVVVHTNDGVYDLTLTRLMGELRPELEMEVVARVTT